MERGRIDLDRLGLRSGQGEAISLALTPDAPTLGGEPYELKGRPVEARVEISRTTSGFALRLLAEVMLTGPCARCLQDAELALRVEGREVEQPTAEDAELSSPYVTDAVLDATAWLHDGIVLALPEKVLCRPDCSGICEICGANLNEVDPAEHSHERPPDPRFAKLRELLDKD